MGAVLKGRSLSKKKKIRSLNDRPEGDMIKFVEKGTDAVLSLPGSDFFLRPGEAPPPRHPLPLGMGGPAAGGHTPCFLRVCKWGFFFFTKKKSWLSQA